jgi:undecaprenyl phosphate-alpha-L-ara4FN deformylase
MHMKHPPPTTHHPAFERVIALKVDVDTFWGMRNGVPRLLDLFKKHGVAVSFFVPMGKDHTGWTAKRVFTTRGFLSKVNRSGPLKTYGLRTLMYGLLLPGPEIAKENAWLLKRVIEEGHELGIHGLDHVFWHDHIKDLGQAKTESILQKAIDVYGQIVGAEPASFAAPGWMINKHAL